MKENQNQWMPKTQEQRLGEVKRLIENVSLTSDPKPEQLLGLRIALDKAIWTMLREKPHRAAVVVSLFNERATVSQIEQAADEFRSRFSNFDLEFDIENRALLARRAGGE